jgi:hypothetical protein
MACVVQSATGMRSNTRERSKDSQPSSRRDIAALIAIGSLCIAALGVGGCGGGGSKPADTGAAGTASGGGGTHDASAGAGSSGQGAAGSSSAGSGGVAGSSDVAAGSGGSGGGAGSVDAGAGSVDGGGGSVDGGGGGGGPTSDLCRACEKTRCKIAQPLTATTSKMGPYGAYNVCFSSVPWPGNPAFCPPYDPSSTNATQGPQKGSAKSDLCQAVLACARSSPHMCAADINLDKCYCGTLSIDECTSGQKVPDGDCKRVVEDAAETTDPNTIGQVSGNPCGAYGAAADVLAFCDSPCCAVECHLAQTAGPPNSQWCIAPGSAGTSGSSGSGGSGSGGGGGAGGAGGS